MGEAQEANLKEDQQASKGTTQELEARVAKNNEVITGEQVGVTKLEVKLADTKSKVSVVEARLQASKSKITMADARVQLMEEHASFIGTH